MVCRNLLQPALWPVTSFREPNRTRGNLATKIAFAAVMAAAFLGLLIYGLRPSVPAFEQGSGLEPLPGAVQTVREDTPIPGCNSPVAIRALTGALVRAKATRINGLSNIEQLGADGDGSLRCRATANLDFSTQSISYTIHKLAPDGRAWELAVTGP